MNAVDGDALPHRGRKHAQQTYLGLGPAEGVGQQMIRVHLIQRAEAEPARLPGGELLDGLRGELGEIVGGRTVDYEAEYGSDASYEGACEMLSKRSDDIAEHLALEYPDGDGQTLAERLGEDGYDWGFSTDGLFARI